MSAEKRLCHCCGCLTSYWSPAAPGFARLPRCRECNERIEAQRALNRARFEADRAKEIR